MRTRRKERKANKEKKTETKLVPQEIDGKYLIKDASVLIENSKEKEWDQYSAVHANTPTTSCHSMVCSSLGEMPSLPCSSCAILVACRADATKAAIDQAQYAAKSTNQKSTCVILGGRVHEGLRRRHENQFTYTFQKCVYKGRSVKQVFRMKLKLLLILELDEVCQWT